MKIPIFAVLVVLLVAGPAFAQGPILYAGLPRAMPLSEATSSSPRTTVQVWNPDLHSSNLTSLTLFPTGSFFSVRVNVTNAGALIAFDVTLNYNVTEGPNILQAVKTGSELSGGLFDPASPPTGCSVLVVKSEIDFPPGEIRFAAVMAGGCTVSGSGTLFTIQFQVTGIGASFIDIVQTNTDGRTASEIVAATPTATLVPYVPVNARFQNVPGIPPVARFGYSPLFPVKGDNISFAGGASFDPDNTSSLNNGISKYLWFFGGSAQWGGPNATHTFIFPIFVPATGNFTVTLVVWDSDSNLPDRLNLTVDVSRGIVSLASSNWSGYAISGPAGSVNDVKGSWKVPAIVGACGASDQYSSFWVGIDGLTSSTVEQTGTTIACIGGVAKYFAWYEFFPKGAMTIHTMTVHPGDTMLGEVSFSSGQFNLTLVDVSTSTSFTKLGKVKGAQLSSAEWIAEAPSNRTGILPLANFGRLSFGQDLTGISGTCMATVNGIAGPIGSFQSHAYQISMLSRDLTLKAAPSPLSPDGSSFVVQWFYSGP